MRLYRSLSYSCPYWIGLAIALFSSTSVEAADSTTAWRTVLSKCAKSDVIGSQSLFFGISNNVGPGSVWRFADDHSLRLLFELSDAFPKSSEQTRLTVDNNVAACAGDSSTAWDLSLGLPFSIPIIGVSANLGSALKGADSVAVSVTGFAIDILKETPWKIAFKRLGSHNPYVQEIFQPNRVIAENVVKVTGIKATFHFDAGLSAKIEAEVNGRVFTIGTIGGGKANLHANVEDKNNLTLTADGPFYLLAAYSKLAGGIPIGLDEVDPSLIVLEPAPIPAGTSAKSDRPAAK